MSFAKMGMVMSLMGLRTGLMPSSQIVSFALETVYKQFMEKEIKNFEDFHLAILDVLTTFNSALPGKHYDVPSSKEIEKAYERWNRAKGKEEKNSVLMEFMKDSVNLSRVDNFTMITGIATPPIAMAAKRAGENVPQLKIIKGIPDVLFVPSATIVSLMSVKMSRRILKGV